MKHNQAISIKVTVASQMFLCCRWEHKWLRYLLVPRSLCLLSSGLTRVVLAIVGCCLRHVSHPACVAFLHPWELCFVYWIQLLLSISHSPAVLHHVHFALSWLILSRLRRWMRRINTTRTMTSLIRSNISREYPLLSLLSFDFVGCKWTQLLMLASIVRLIHLLLAS